MSETAVQESICDICGVDVRDGSLFCYNCGSSVTGVAGLEEAEKEADGSPSPESKLNGVATIDKDKELVKRAPANRIRPRKRPVQKREVMWATREGMSLSFVVTTFILVLLTAVILIAGFYFR